MRSVQPTSDWTCWLPTHGRHYAGVSANIWTPGSQSTRSFRIWRPQQQEWARGVALQGEIWTQATTACRAQGDPPSCMLLLPALNEMIDITTTRKMSTLTHPPTIIFVLLFGLALGCSLVAGYSMAGSTQRSWIHMIVFAAMTAVTVYVILDIEYPRLGLIRVDAADQVLVELRESMK